MKKQFWFLKFSKGHYPGIVILLFIIALLQVLIYFNNHKDNSEFVKLSQEDLNWLQEQNIIDSLKENNLENSNKIYPFNPNFISDYKGYKLGMTIAEINKLQAFRKLNKYVNSNAEFQKLTGVSNDWMKQYAQYFKFPNWIANKEEANNKYSFEKMYPNIKTVKTSLVIQNINTANQEELEKVFMIGEKMALKIISEREKLGNFVSMQQLEWIWGISPEAIVDLNKKFQVKSNSEIKKIKINELTTKELQQFPYFNYSVAKNIVTYRSMNDEIKSIEDLTKIKDFPVDKLKIIALYLEF